MMQNSRNTYIQIKQNIFALKALFYSQQLYIYEASRNCIYSTLNSDTKLYSFQGTLSVRSRKYILVSQWKHIHSGKLYPFKKICSFKEHIFVQVQGYMFIQGNYIYWTMLHSRNSRNIYSKIVPSHFIIIISFTITISWIKYSYNFSSVEAWRNCWYDRGFCNIITVRVVFATIVRRNTSRSVSRFRHYIFAKIWYVRQQAFYI